MPRRMRIAPGVWELLDGDKTIAVVEKCLCRSQVKGLVEEKQLWVVREPGRYYREPSYQEKVYPLKAGHSTLNDAFAFAWQEYQFKGLVREVG